MRTTNLQRDIMVELKVCNTQKKKRKKVTIILSSLHILMYNQNIIMKQRNRSSYLYITFLH